VSRVPVVALAVLLAGSAAFALGAVTKDQLIRACADKKTGALRLAAKCTKSERAVSWNKAGPQGKPGAAGAPGQQGPAGTAGAAGAQGPPGTARAYVTVRPDECFSPTFTCSIYNVKNVASVRRVSTGTYCVTPAEGMSFQGVTPAMTTDAFNSGPANGFGIPIVAYASLVGPCTTGELRIQTFRASGSPIAIALSNNTSFALVIP
jgi:hypothetical protein